MVLDPSIDRITVELSVRYNMKASSIWTYYSGQTVVANAVAVTTSANDESCAQVSLDTKWNLWDNGEVVQTFHGTPASPALAGFCFTTLSPDRFYELRKA